MKHSSPTIYDEIRQLLKEASLPFQDIEEDQISFITKFEREKLIACAALEINNTYGLLRSVVVHPKYQNKGIAHKLVLELVEHAINQDLHSLYLLTETAESYFERFGFQKIERGLVPTCIQQTKEFTELCPSTAICMRLIL